MKKKSELTGSRYSVTLFAIRVDEGAWADGNLSPLSGLRLRKGQTEPTVYRIEFLIRLGLSHLFLETGHGMNDESVR